MLLPVLDDAKHYWVATDEVDKLLRRGEGWLADAPGAGADHPPLPQARAAAREPGAGRRSSEPRAGRRPHARRALEEPESRCSDQRLGTVQAVAARPRARAACSTSAAAQGALLERLLRGRLRPRSSASTCRRARSTIAARRLKLDASGRRRASALLQSPLTYRDKRLEGYDAAVLIEVIEHLDPPRLPALEDACSAPPARDGLVTTPNAEYNVRWETLPAGQFRHRDHRFEWTRAEFARLGRRAWPTAHGYDVAFVPVGAGGPGGRAADADGGVRRA